MSVQVPEITINVIGLGVTDPTQGLKLIKKQIHLAIIRGIKRVINDAIDLAEVIVPESIERDPPYPDSYVSEELLDSFVVWMKKELRRLRAGTRTLKDVYTIVQFWEVTYAEFVNRMGPGTKWSKLGSHGGFIETIDAFIEANLQNYIQHFLQKLSR